jgi:hypothetical protein
MTKVNLAKIDDLDFSNNPNNQVKILVDDALKFLDTRTEFWRQQKPIYARKKEMIKMSRTINFPKPHLSQSARNTPVPDSKQRLSRPKSCIPTKSTPVSGQQVIDTGLEAINTSLAKHDYITALRKTKALLSKLPELDIDITPRLNVELLDILAGIYVKLGAVSDAILSYRRELEQATEHSFFDCVKRCLVAI